MLIHFVLFLEIVLVTFFILAFFFRKILFWVLSFFLSGLLMFLSYNIEVLQMPSMLPMIYIDPFLLSFNLLFFLLSCFYLIVDIWDSFGFLVIKQKK